jgi:hypothetical protein
MEASFWPSVFEKPEILGVLLPFVAIIAFAIVIIVKFLIHHRERMAMIVRGIHPDYPPEDEQMKSNFPTT